MTTTLPAAGALGVAPRGRRRTVAWISLAVLVVFAVLLAILASVGTVTSDSPLVGKPAPALAGTTLAGGTRIDLRQDAGRWVLVDFAASYCFPCRLEMPQIQAFAAGAAARDATVLMVAYAQSDQSDLARYLAGLHAGWPTIADPAAQIDWGLTGVPDTFLVAPDGTVVEYIASGFTAAAADATIARLSGTS